MIETEHPTLPFPYSRCAHQVNSTNVLAASSALDYPYPNAGSLNIPGGMSRNNNNVGSLYPAGYSMMQPPAATAYPVRNGSVNGQHYCLSTRHPHPSVAHPYNLTNLNDDTFSNYGQAPHYLLPTQDPPMSTYGTQDTSRHWTPIASNRQPGSVGYDSDPSLKYGASGFPYLNASAVASMPENFGMNSLSLSRDVPRHGDRVLPTPRKTSYDTSSNSYPKSGESASYGLRSGVSWNLDTLTNATSQGSVSSSSLSAFGGSLSSVSTSPPTESSQGATTFGYVPLSRSPLHQPLPMAGAKSTQAETARPKGRTILPSRPLPSLYSYEPRIGVKSDSRTDSSLDNTLVNGKRYTRIQEKPLKYNIGDPLPVDPAPLVPAHKSTPVTTQSRPE
ncbi:MAG: hypothetical protein Q9219_002276 [cf. Caloplaca sp. 3 TL-2023]